jgi:putative glutathione S-transferase
MACVSRQGGLETSVEAHDDRGTRSTNTAAYSQAFVFCQLAPQTKDGAYARPSYNVNEQIGSNSFPIAAGQYHLYTGNPCPWCHRVLLAHSLNGLEEFVGASRLVDDPTRASRGGWTFDTGDSAVDSVFGARDLRGVYDLCSPGYTGRCTAPLLVDKKRKRLVNNESAKIVRMFNTLRFSKEQHNKYFGDGWLPALSPQHLIDEIDEMNAYLLHHLNSEYYQIL